MANSKGKSEEVVLDLDTLGVPIAIVVSVLVLSGLVFLASRNTAEVDTTNTDVISAEDEFVDGMAVTLGDDPYLGDKETATVAIIDFSDYQCGYCERHKDETLPELIENYVDTGKILYVFKEFPLSPQGNIGYTTAGGASCVFSLGGLDAYKIFHDEGYFLGGQDDVVALAVKSGVEESAFKSCLDNGDYVDEISLDAQEGSSAGVTGTPGFVVGLIGEDGVVTGELIAGAYPYDTFASTIEKLLGE